MFTSFRKWFNRQRRQARTSLSARSRWRLTFDRLEDRTVPSLTVLTDKADYLPGEFATITANGLQLGETAQLQVLHIDGTPNTGAGHQPWQVTDGVTTPSYVDGQGMQHLPDLDGIVNGSIQTSWYVNPDDSLSSTFELTATELSSGLVAQTTFTDGVVLVGSVTKNFRPASSGDVSSATFYTLSPQVLTVCLWSAS